MPASQAGRRRFESGRPLLRIAAVAAAGMLLSRPLVAQRQWVPPQPPCDISPGLFRLNSVPVNFRIAAQPPNELDSAAAYYRQAVQASAADTAYRDARRDALATIGRISVRSAQADPAVQRAQRLRLSRDSLAPLVANDSIVLERMKQSASSRRARGARLSPADQQAFRTDSAAREQGLARGRAARAALEQQAGADSSAVRAAYDPAITAYRDLVAAYPTSLDAALTLAGLYSQSGRSSEATGALDAFFSRSGDVEADTLFTLGERLVRARLFATGITAYPLGLRKNPYHR